MRGHIPIAGRPGAESDSRAHEIRTASFAPQFYGLTPKIQACGKMFQYLDLSY